MIHDSVAGCIGRTPLVSLRRLKSSSGLKKLLSTFPPHYQVVTIFPDRGDRYLETVYSDEWLSKPSHAQIPTVSG